MTVSIRVEQASDFERVSQLTVDAFSQSALGHHGEADLVAKLRTAGCQSLSLVACVAEEIVGHILFTPTSLRPEAGPAIQGMGLAPMAVTPLCQRRGVGGALVEAGLTRLRNDDWPFVVVLGHTEYYQRFGFRPAATLGWSHGFQGIPQEPFLALALAKDQGQLPSGAVHYQPEFGPQHLSDS